MSEELTESELDKCWYCEDCSKPMREDDDGYFDEENKLSFCSANCAEEYGCKHYED